MEGKEERKEFVEKKRRVKGRIKEKRKMKSRKGKWNRIKRWRNNATGEERVKMGKRKKE